MWLIGIVLLVLSLGSLVLPWVQRVQINQLRKDVARLSAKLEALGGQGRTVAQPSHATSVSTQSPWKRPVAAVSPEPDEILDTKDGGSVEMQWTPAVARQSEPKRSRRNFNFEQQFGANLPVWIGGIALALAGVFMDKYSIETGLLSPLVRLTLGGLFGGGLLAAARWLRARPHITLDPRIPQALAGAGLVDWYACVFAATSIYHYLPAELGFAAMALVTGLAVFESLLHGVPIALIGLAGGFLTPALVGSGSGNATVLFVYLYVLLAGILNLSSRKGWWFLSVPSVFAAFAWVLLWILSPYGRQDALTLSLFVIAVAGTVVHGLRAETARLAGGTWPVKLLHLMSAGGSLLLLAMISALADYSLVQWGLYGALAAGCLVLAYFDERQYAFLPRLALPVSLAMLLTWSTVDYQSYAYVLLAFALLFGAGGAALMWTARRPGRFAWLSAVSALAFFILAYLRLDGPSGFMLGGLSCWSVLAMLLAALEVAIAHRVVRYYSGSKADQNDMLAASAFAATAFVAAGSFIALSYEWFSLALCVQMLATSWIQSRLALPSLRNNVRLLAIGFLIIAAPQLLDVLEYVLKSFDGGDSYIQRKGMIARPWLHMGIPALAFGGSAVLLARTLDDRMVRRFELLALSLGSGALYFGVRHLFHPDSEWTLVAAGFAERAVITNLCLLLALAVVWGARRFGRVSLEKASLFMTKIALFRLCYFDLFAFNPVWTHQPVGAWPLLNSLLLAYALPPLWLMAIEQRMGDAARAMVRKFSQPVMLALVFALVSLNVRQFFHGEYLDGDVVSNAEIYAYSAAWLLMGVVLLLVGTFRSDRALRLAALAFMMVSVCKVFLYDASELTGLLRVFSFLGLGLSLMGLSWFYTRFVVGRK